MENSSRPSRFALGLSVTSEGSAPAPPAEFFASFVFFVIQLFFQSLNCSRSLAFIILPVEVRGISATKTNPSGSQIFENAGAR